MKTCTCKSKENNGYHCEHGNWIKSEYAKRGYRKAPVTAREIVAPMETVIAHQQLRRRNTKITQGKGFLKEVRIKGAKGTMSNEKRWYTVEFETDDPEHFIESINNQHGHKVCNMIVKVIEPDWYGVRGKPIKEKGDTIL